MTLISLTAAIPTSVQPGLLVTAAQQFHEDKRQGLIHDVEKQTFEGIITNPALQDQNALTIFSNRALTEKGIPIPDYISDVLTNNAAPLTIGELRSELIAAGLTLPDIRGTLSEEQKGLLLQMEQAGNLSVGAMRSNDLLTTRTGNALIKAGLTVSDIRVLGDIIPERFLEIPRIGSGALQEINSIITELQPFPVNDVDHEQDPVSIITEASKGVYQNFGVQQSLYLFEKFGIRTEGQLTTLNRQELIEAVQSDLNNIEAQSKPGYDELQKRFYKSVIAFLEREHFESP